MKLKSYSILSSVLLLVTACSPRIGTVITKTYPSLESNDQVKVFINKRMVLVQSESLGVVSVGDTGFTLKCDSSTVIGIMKEKARQSGGNAVLITEYIKPSFWGSSCHQMTATVLRVSDFSSVEDTDEGGSYDEDIRLLQPKRKLPKMDLMASVGYGNRLGRLNEMLSPSQRQSMEDLLSGIIWDLSFKYYFIDTGGLGIDYSVYSATTNKLANDVVPTTDIISYAGLSYLGRLSAKQTWIFDLSVGLGYLDYSSMADLSYIDRKITGSTLGWKFALGASYKFSKNWGIGAEIASLSGFLDKINVYEAGVKRSVRLEERESLAQFRIGLGVHYYIH